MARNASNVKGGSEWLEDWDPNNEAKWDSKIAWRTLWISTYALTLGFISWYLVSALAPKLNNLGFDLSKKELYWLAAMPGLAGGGLRLLWMFMPPLLGTRRLVTYSTGLLILPLLGWSFAVRNPETPYVGLLALAFLAGLGGGVFSGFMPSTSYFFPKSKQGLALGIQAGVGNFGVSIVQFVTPIVVGSAMLGSTLGAEQRFVDAAKGIDKSVWYQNAGLLWIPFVVVAVILAWTLLKSVPVTSRGMKEQLDIFSNKHTWLMTLLYVMTFGTFSGLAAQFGLLTKNLFGDFANAPDPVKYAFYGPLIASAARVLTGPIADRTGGGILTVFSGLGIAGSSIFTALQLSPQSSDDFMKFFWGMIAIFFFAGVGNASTFKQMPMIFQPRQAGGVIGWTAAIAAFGPFIFGILLSEVAPKSFFLGVSLFALGCTFVAWWYYTRRGAEKPC
ncbi:MAG: MFS transporter [Candidatus Nanopelagicaceae bacterium]|nr:MFS transporter [Candidatus Nanopelagicaceae bacterium]